MSDVSSVPENWRGVVGYERYYEVSDLGRVRSLDRVFTRTDGIRSRARGQVLKGHSLPTGHRFVSLYVDNERRERTVHSLVLEAFVGSRPPKAECCHGDGDPTNNHLVNLRWDSSSANNYDMVRHGTHNNAVKTHCPRGHWLVAPNLMKSKLPWRECKSCNMGRSRAAWLAKKGRPASVAECADRYYARMDIR